MLVLLYRRSNTTVSVSLGCERYAAV